MIVQPDSPDTIKVEEKDGEIVLAIRASYPSERLYEAMQMGKHLKMLLKDGSINLSPMLSRAANKVEAEVQFASDTAKVSV